jgi:diguanylate cyclase (GGDEF)-like protein
MINRIAGNRKYKLTTLLVMLVAASVLLVAIIQSITSYQSEKEVLVDATLASNYSKANKIGRGANALFQSMSSSLRTTADYLAATGSIADEDVQDRIELVRTASRYFNSMTWIDETGLIRAISPISIGLKGKQGSAVAMEALQAKTTYISLPYIGATGRLLILISEPFYDSSGQYRGIIGGTIYLQEENVLSEFLTVNERDPNGSYYYVAGPDGTLLYHPDDIRIGENASSNPIIQRLIAGESGTGRVTNTQGVAMLAAYSYVEETGWGVVQQTPVRSVKQQLLDHVRKNLMYLVLPFLAVLGISIVFARKLGEPVKNLAGLVSELTAGKLESIPPMKPHWNEETDVLMTTVAIAFDRVHEKNEWLVKEASTDALTGLANRRSMTELMETWSAEARMFTIMIMDIDHFKKVNDTYGHQTGDEVLKFLADHIKSIVRPGDLCFRYGGEEFVVLMPNTAAAESLPIAETIRETISRRVSPTGEPITLSLGIAAFPTHSGSLEEAFGFADEALYRSKADGRNRVSIYT